MRDLITAALTPQRVETLTIALTAAALQNGYQITAGILIQNLMDTLRSRGLQI